MSTWRLTVDVEVDDDAMADHDGANQTPPNEVEDWYGGDLVEAIDKGLVEVAIKASTVARERGRIVHLERLS